MKKAELLKLNDHNFNLIEKYSEEPIKVLDHGHVRLVNLMGQDQAIVQAARVSYGLGQSEHMPVPVGDSTPLDVIQWAAAPHITCNVCGRDWAEVKDRLHCPEGDRRLIRYLSRQRHTTPLEMCEIQLHMKMPIFVARQFIRHRTANVNEYSMRYSPAIDDFYLIGVDGWRGQSVDNKQGSSGTIGAAMGKEFTAKSVAAHQAAMKEYEDKIRYGVAKELARCDLQLSMYTEWYWKIDLHNMLHFLSLRMDPHAQYEIRVYADAMAEIVKRWVPFAWEAFVDYRFKAAHFSRQELALLQDIATGVLPPSWHVNLEERKAIFDKYGVETTRERKAFMQKLKLSK